MKKSDSPINGIIFSFRWKNFRSLKNPGWVDIKPLTVFIGPNNSGKTSFIDPLLIVKQTVESRDTSLPFKINGKYVKVGDYKTLINAHDVRKILNFDFRFPKCADERRKDIGKNRPGTILVSFQRDSGKNEIRLKSIEVKDIFNRTMLKRALLKDGSYSLENFFKNFTSKEKEIQLNIEKSKPTHFWFDYQGIIKHLFKSILSEGRISDEEKDKKSKEGSDIIEIKMSSKSPNATVFYCHIFNYVLDRIKDIVEKIDYIGPLRQYPQRFYESIGEKPQSVGSSGQFTPDLLLRMKKEKSLDSLNEWFKKFDFKGDIKCKLHPSGLISITEKSSKTNIADFGFGFSQILPLITQGLWMDEGRTLIAEQPEIHLNPKLQTVLADFFVHIVNTGKSVILETHSEHLLMRLRTLIANPDNEIKSSDVALYFVEINNGETSITHIPIEDDGYIADDNWPKNFFDDTLSESFNLANMQSKRKKNASKS